MQTETYAQETDGKDLLKPKTSTQLLYHTSSFSQPLASTTRMGDQQTLSVTKMTITDPIQRRYEESKNQFEQCLREAIIKQTMLKLHPNQQIHQEIQKQKLRAFHHSL